MKGTSTCDICGKSVHTLTRRYKGEGYCSKCYARYFVKRLCPKCGESARLSLDDTSAICRKCEVAKPCIRCGKNEYKTGKVTRYGPVCNACSVYFRKPRACPRCGKLSRRLSRAFKLGITEQVCPQCSSHGRGTCSSCRRHRHLYESPTGEMLCKACLSTGKIPCPECGQLMPAGRKNKCEPCYWLGVLHKRIKLDCVAFSSQIMAEHFETFGKWLGGHSGYKKASLTIHRYLPFFKDIESRWSSIPRYPSLLAAYGVSRLRQQLLPMKWMVENDLIQIDLSLKAEATENRLIQNILGSLSEGKVKNVLLEYHGILNQSYNQSVISLRSVRLALQPATQLLSEANRHNRIVPNQSDIFSLLHRVPGQRNALSKFVGFLNKKFGESLRLPPPTKKAFDARRKRFKEELIRLLVEQDGSLKYKKRLLGVALAYFHDLPLIIGQTHLHIVKSDPSGGLTLQFKGQNYWLPEDIRNRLFASL